MNPEIIPLGEGQRDWELIVEVGHSMRPRSMYVSGWLGYRWREANNDIDIDFGDEVFFLAAFGGSFGRLGYKLAVDGIAGLTPELQGVRVENARRGLYRLLPSLFWRTGYGHAQVGTRLPFFRQEPARRTVIDGRVPHGVAVGTLAWCAAFPFGRPSTYRLDAGGVTPWRA